MNPSQVSGGRQSVWRCQVGKLQEPVREVFLTQDTAEQAHVPSEEFVAVAPFKKAVVYRIDTQERIVHLATASAVTFEQWRDAMWSLLSDPAFETGFDFLSTRGPGVGPPSAEFALKAAAFYRGNRERFGRCRWAAVVAGDVTTYDTIRKLALMSDGTDIHVMVFREIGEAREWLLSCRLRDRGATAARADRRASYFTTGKPVQSQEVLS